MHAVCHAATNLMFRCCMALSSSSPVNENSQYRGRESVSVRLRCRHWCGLRMHYIDDLLPYEPFTVQLLGMWSSFHYIPSSNFLFWNSKGIKSWNLSQIQVNMERNILKFVIRFIFKLCHFKAFDDYVTLHNLSMLLTYIVTLNHTMKLLGMW